MGGRKPEHFEQGSAMKFDDGEMVVVRHEYEDVWVDGKGVEHRERQSDAFYAVREPQHYELSAANPMRWGSETFRVLGDVYLGSLDDVAGYRKLLDAVEARLIARKEASNDV